MNDSGRKTDDERRTELEDDEVQDDAVIGVAFRWSLLIAAIVAVLAVFLVVLRGEPETQELVDEAPLSAPRVVESSVEPPAVSFVDITAQAGIDFVHVNGAYGEKLLPETMGGGVAFFDMDGDADQDLLFVNGRTWPWREPHDGAASTAALYRNDGSGQFTDVTKGSGLDESLYGMGVAVGDYDGDRRTDLFVAAVGSNRLYRNLGDGRFAAVADGPAGDPEAWSTSAAFFDYDRDGDLDLVVSNYVRWSRDIDLEVDYRMAGIGRAYGPPTNYAGTHNQLYRNDDGRFVDVSVAAGLHVVNPATGQPMGKGLAVRPLDIDNDGWLDIAVANDTVGNFLFRNLADGRFEEIGALAGIAYDGDGSATGAMGIDSAAFNNNGDIGVAIGNFANEMTSFYVAQGGGAVFTDESIVCGIGPQSRRALSFGLFFFDYDLDGREDLLQVNGHVEDEINVVQPSQHHAQPAQLFWNCGPECPRNFVLVPPASTGDLATPRVGRGAAYADIDADGDLDVALTQTGGAAVLLRNEQQTGHHWLRVELIDTTRNTAAIGARLTLHSGAVTQNRMLMPARSYLSQVEAPVTFGLGNASTVDKLVVRWPDGVELTLDTLDADRSIVVERSAQTQ